MNLESEVGVLWTIEVRMYDLLAKSKHDVSAFEMAGADLHFNVAYLTLSESEFKVSAYELRSYQMQIKGEAECELPSVLV